MNMNQFTQKTLEALQSAQRLAVEYSNNAVEQEHLLAALAQQQDGLIPQLLTKLGATPMPLHRPPCKKSRPCPASPAPVVTPTRSIFPAISTAP